MLFKKLFLFGSLLGDYLLELSVVLLALLAIGFELSGVVFEGHQLVGEIFDKHNDLIPQTILENLPGLSSDFSLLSDVYGRHFKVEIRLIYFDDFEVALALVHLALSPELALQLELVYNDLLAFTNVDLGLACELGQAGKMESQVVLLEGMAFEL